MDNKKRFYITTAISYPNAKPHIGHAYELIATDALARFQRLDGKDVFFVTGTDEHGQKMQQTAKIEGITVAELAHRNTQAFRDMAVCLNISHDDFIQTTEQRHHQCSQELWNRMLANGDIYKGFYSGWYSIRDEAYYQESEILLGDDNNHYGPQGTVVEWVEEDSYFFRLSAYQESLLSLYEEKPDFIAPSERRNEIVTFVKSGLKDISISRSRKKLNWGIRVPNDPDHIMYVWVDALSNYLTATGVLEKGCNPRSSFWPANLQIIGKDIIRFHAVYWPAFLMSAGLSLPDRIFSHGFILNKGEKMSKSLGNVMDPIDLVDCFGVDCLRYFFLREVSFGQDGSYSAKNIITRMNADLANGIGNLTSRSLSMIFKHCDARIPEYQTLIPVDQTMMSSVDILGKTVRVYMNEQEIHRALEKIMAVVSETDRYFSAQQPWALKTMDPVRMATVLYVTAEVIRQIALLLLPFIPASADKILDFLSVPQDQRVFSFLGEQGRLIPGMAVEMPWAVFPRYNV